ncbi:unnamed protein product [Dovyalis caffra]|uniref:Uncharacterized protein n=1 Tax=Dovyalis caffra TaxID=77055 RepID=A0AAV1SQV2_9ROSI|nr:unnamed protein product [Dovyalis caffra]
MDYITKVASWLSSQSNLPLLSCPFQPHELILTCLYSKKKLLFLQGADVGKQMYSGKTAKIKQKVT